ncbi:purple acid phosphatase family protein [Niabella drilacis]|uniref:Purple acid Phosphatase, N-terminal domain n=1 Tax=Niabella drilacis (strain DSM 25811 / CCM 8410 / CCUG 62505 / LMG 26954 / E90) TaxID=1285928 RepID=A0A1G6R4M4_NIADE|nr:metallophosphoesterase family protein [Niabella drilacis]SDC99580.1 Purple acid Phosphatase, N-terminal domain [Niabella drilacis]
MNSRFFLSVLLHCITGMGGAEAYAGETSRNFSDSSQLLTRGPYLQMGSETAVTIRWRTRMATDSRVEIGTQPGRYKTIIKDRETTTEHVVQVSGLKPDTRYYYRVGSSTGILQGNKDNYFRTAPPEGTQRKIRIAAFGDCGTNSKGYQAGSLNSYLRFTGTNPAEIMLLLGDNAYSSGKDSEYSKNFFPAYEGTVLKNHVLFPAPGNHDYYSSSQASRDGAYYRNFTMPTAAECGGVASGTEAYYSYNWGNIHFLSLDSYGTETDQKLRLYDTLGPQVTWIKKDLAANTRKWVIAYWHHPPYTMGSHNSDKEAELVHIRENFIRILERMGVDLVLCGHSHNYERSRLMHGHYGPENDFDPGIHALSASSGKYDGSENSDPYITASGKANKGTVYVVAGSAGASGHIQSGYPHNAMPYSMNDGGMLYLEVEGNRLDARFIRRDSVVADQFTIFKDVSKNVSKTVRAGSKLRLSASWPGAYRWSNGERSRSINVRPSRSQNFFVTDGRGSLADTIRVKVVSR